MPVQQDLLVHLWEQLSMQDVGPGDADVNTKDGRHTTVRINMTAPTVDQGRQRLRSHVIYDVIEGRKDWTHLQLNSDILLPIPHDWKNVKIVGDVADFKLQFVVYGKNHAWNLIDVNSSTWMQNMEAKIDGPGDDNRGNAGLRIGFAIRLEHE